MMFKRWNLSAAFAVVLIALPAWGEDWPQWRGPDRSDVSKETGLLKQWPEKGPRKVWSTDKAGLGYSGLSVVGKLIYTLGAEGQTEYLMAFDVVTGKRLWATPIGDRLGNGWGDGPRGTPSVDEGRVYAISGQGNILCVDAKDGKAVWNRSMRELGGNVPGWGYTESPLVDGQRVVLTPGGKKGTLAALDKATGNTLWQSTGITVEAQYSSPIVAEHNGARQYIQLTMSKLFGVDAQDGKVLWTSDWPGRTAVIPTPIFHEGQVFITSGYGVGCKLIQLAPNHEAKALYKNNNLINHHGGVVLIDGHIYGHSDAKGWTCLDLKTGEPKWQERRLDKGAISAADGMLYLLGEESGACVLIEASPQGWREHGRFTLTPQTKQRNPRGRIWVHPVISNGRLYLRDQELIHSYDIQQKT
jgi:outer membrane protein assembly factor BamB